MSHLADEAAVVVGGQERQLLVPAPEDVLQADPRRVGDLRAHPGQAAEAGEATEAGEASEHVAEGGGLDHDDHRVPGPGVGVRGARVEGLDQLHLGTVGDIWATNKDMTHVTRHDQCHVSRTLGLGGGGHESQERGSCDQEPHVGAGGAEVKRGLWPVSSCGWGWAG